ncbi:L-ornithine N5-oxygenase [Herbihabitans rhizosphaerae]|uniref:L-lysine N6-monooxygenase MbtG n=1 Tax=Herbihabitans rhizosphaerae TaxID=1872711 RepID=A0A4Q7L3U4_9PSEU|nr:lysine N(6)-hydroxylase/L-ornithine N(5)-oxygenase family protein [Herbihabitans rhizosphaerae]RZS43131.1 L-ornithine N5-oxygenase [Herbihabitans rhizosphaerae]
MTEVFDRDDVPVYDMVGVGFGPSNLALAIALTERNASAENTVTAHFLERQAAFGWHRGMLIDDATMQVSFLKDLVTLRDPASRFSFLCYLQAHGRLVDFVNHKSLFPLRVEFHDYLEWAAAQVDDLVAYEHEVVGVEPVRRDGVVEMFDVHARAAGATEVYRARNLVIGTGLRPMLPEGVRSSDVVWHNSDLLTNAEKLTGTEPSRFIVVGAGQSAAEAVAYLHRTFPTADVCGVFARYGYSPADDSPFANRIFDPGAVDDFYSSPEEFKQRLVGYHANTNYSVVDADLIEELYRRVYQEKVLGIERLRLYNTSRLADLAEVDGGVRGVIESLVTGERLDVTADAVVYATGYSPADPLPVLGDLGELCLRDDADRLRVDRDYRVRTAPELGAGVYLQGGTEHTHGITSSLLSNVAVRAAEILDSITDSVADSAAERPVTIPAMVSAARG